MGHCAEGMLNNHKSDFDTVVDINRNSVFFQSHHVMSGAKQIKCTSSFLPPHARTIVMMLNQRIVYLLVTDEIYVLLLLKCIVVIYLCRMLSDTAEHREAMLSHGALKPVASLLRSDDTTSLLSAVKTVSCFIHGLDCTFCCSALSFYTFNCFH